MASALRIIEIPLGSIPTSSTIGRLFVSEGLGKWGKSSTGPVFHRRVLDADAADLADRVAPQLVVSVMRSDERDAWSMRHLPNALSVFGIGFAEFSLGVGAEGDDDRVVAAALVIRAALLQGQRVVVMARGLRGRSTRVVLAALMSLGLRPDTAARIVGGAMDGSSIADLTRLAERSFGVVRDAFVAMGRTARFSRAPQAKGIAALVELTGSSPIAFDVGAIALAFGTVLARHGTLNARRLAEELHAPGGQVPAIEVGAPRWLAWVERVSGGPGEGVCLMAEDDRDLDERSLVALMAAQIPIAYVCRDDPERRADLATLSARALSWHRGVAVAAVCVADLFATAFQHRPSPSVDELARQQLEQLRSEPTVAGLTMTERVMRAFLGDAAATLDDRASILPSGVTYAPVLKALHRAVWRPEEAWWLKAYGDTTARVVEWVGALERARHAATEEPVTVSTLAMEVVARIHELGYESTRNASYIKAGLASLRFSLTTENDFQARRRRPFDGVGPFFQANLLEDVGLGGPGISGVFEGRGIEAGEPGSRFYPAAWGARRIAENIVAHEVVRRLGRACTSADPDHVEWYQKVVGVAGARGVLLYDFDPWAWTGDQVYDPPLPHMVRFPFSDVSIELPGRQWVHAGRKFSQG